MFLMGLDEQRYGTTQFNILAQDPLPSLYKVYSILIQEEQVKNIARGREEHGEIMALVTCTRFDGRGKGSTLCSYYNKYGHEAENCFVLKGYPNWWGDRPRGDGRRGIGHGRGPLGAQSGGKGGGRTHRGTHRANATTEGEDSPLSGLNVDQW